MKKNNAADQLQILNASREDPGCSAVRVTPLPAADPDIMLDVIVPAYNVEQYIGACMKSILSQKTRYPFRVTVVDDGASDRTGEIIDEYQNHPLVTVIHQKNKGLSGARNTGLLHSKGKYLLFVDSDDLLAPGAVEHLIALAEENNADIAAGGYRNFRRFTWLSKNHPQKSGILCAEKDMSGHAWGRICRRSLFENAQFPEGCWFEDSLMHHIIFPQAQICAGTGRTVCYRRSNPASITHTAAGNPKSIDTVWLTLHLLEDRKTLQIPLTQQYYDYLLEQIRLNHTRLRGLGEEIQKAAFLAVADSICGNFPQYRTETETNRETESAVRQMDYSLFEKCFLKNKDHANPAKTAHRSVRNC